MHLTTRVYIIMKTEITVDRDDTSDHNAEVGAFTNNIVVFSLATGPLFL